MTDTGIDLPSFLVNAEPIATEVQPAITGDKMADVREAIRLKRKSGVKEVHHEHTNTVQTLETVPPEMLDAMQVLLAELPTLSNRLNRLEAHAEASQELHTALSALQSVNGLFDQMNKTQSARVDAIEMTLAEFKTMIGPLDAFLTSLGRNKAA